MRMKHTDGRDLLTTGHDSSNHIRGVERVEVLTAIARSADGTFIECRWVDCSHSVPE